MSIYFVFLRHLTFNESAQQKCNKPESLLKAILTLPIKSYYSIKDRNYFHSEQQNAK